MNDGPAVVAELRSDLLTGHVWHVPRCPFCKRGHDYAAGGPDEPDPRRHLGARLTLCPFRARWVWLEERQNRDGRERGGKNDWRGVTASPQRLDRPPSPLGEL